MRDFGTVYLTLIIEKILISFKFDNTVNKINFKSWKIIDTNRWNIIFAISDINTNVNIITQWHLIK